MGDLQATTLTGRETTLPAAAVEEFKKSLLRLQRRAGDRPVPDEDHPSRSRPAHGTG